jgi:biopolymer transport protein ExbB
MGKVCSGFRALDAVAQLGPLLGLFGTVLGMIEAFRAMQGAGAAVDPGVLAGGIWTALLTTAVGLAVAMTTSALLTWLEARAAAEQQMADLMIETLCAPALPPANAPVPDPWAGLAHA